MATMHVQTSASWQYCSEGIYKEIVSVSNSTSKKIKINSVSLSTAVCANGVKLYNSSSLPGGLTGDGNPLTTTCRFGSSAVSSPVTISNTASALTYSLGTYPNPEHCQYHTWIWETPPVLNPGESSTIYIMTPSTREGSKGGVLCFDNGTSYPSTGNVPYITYEEVQDTFTITYDANGGSGAPSSQTGTLPITISTQKPVRTNCLFDRWCTNKDGTGTNYAPGSAYNTQSNVTLYAIWKYKVTLNGNGGTVVLGSNSGSTLDIYKSHDVDLSLSEAYVSYDEESGKYFNHWNTSSDDSGTSYSSSYTADAPIVLYSIPGSQTFTATFYDGHTSAILKTVSGIPYGGSLSSSDFPPDPVWEGHKFSGWWGNWKNITSNTKIVAMWGKSSVWIMTPTGWAKYIPQERN